MAIEKNSFKSSRLESEFSSHSREVMSSDEEEFRYNSGAVESEDDDDDDEFDDCDSGAGSDDFDLLELGESGEEFCQVGDQTCSIPYELYDLQGLGDVLSMDVWNDVLTEEERFCLTQYLPDMDQETFMRTLKDLLTGCNLHFGNPLNKLFNMLKGGLCEPRVALYRQGLIFFQKHQHYHLLRKYQNVMVNSFCQIRDGWQNCRGYSIEEKLRVLNIMKTQNSYISEKMEEMESDESDREGSGDAFWGKRVKDRKHGQKSARYSGYGMGSGIDLLYPGKQTAAEPAKFGKQNSKGALKLTGTKGSTMKEFSSNFPSVHHEMEINAGYYGSQPLSHHGKVAGYDSGMAVHMRDRLLGDEDDDDEGMYEVSAQRNFSRAGLKDKAGHFKMGKKHDGLRSEEYLESLNGFPMPLKPELYATGRKKTIHQLLDTTVSKPLNARAPFDFGSKANYVENLQQFPSEDRMIYGKGRISNPSLKGSRMELADESEPFWHGKRQLDRYLTNPSQKYSDWNSKSKKWKHQESSELKQNDFHSGYKAKPFQEKFRATLHSDQRGVAGSKGRRGVLKNEETESDSSEEIDEEDDDNPLLRSKLAFPFPCDASDMKSGSNAKKAKFVKKNKRGGFDEHLSSIKAGNLGSKAEQKGKMLDYSRVNILSSRELEENYLSGQGQLIDDNDEDDDNDDQPIYKLARNGRIQGDYRPSLREKQKGRFGVPQSNCMQDFGLHGEDLSRTQLLANDNEGIPRSGKKSQILEMLAGDHQERSDLQLIGCSSTLKKRKIKEDVSFMDEQGDNEFTQLQLEDASSSKKRGKRKLESETGNSEKGVSELPSSDIREDVHQESILQKKPFTLITPTVHTGFSFSIIHLLSAIRMAMTSLLSEDSLEIGKNLDQDDGRQKSEEERCLKQEGLNGVKTQAELDVNGSLSSYEMRIPSLAVQEIVNRVKSNPGDPCILETQEPLQDLVRGVLKIFSSKTAPLGAKGWKPLVVYEKSTKSWSWVGPVHHTSSDHEAMEEVTSPEAWGLNHKMLVKLVDSFANWLKNGQETLQQIGSLPAPPSSLTQYNFDEKERFRDLRAQKSLITITPSSEEVRAYFRKEEVLRYSIPDRAFSYTAIDGKKSIVAPLRRCGGKPTSKARDHFMLKRDRPPHVTILCLVRDAAARLPGSIGTRADVCTLIRDSQYIVEDVSDTQVNQVVSGALDRLHYERDPCVQFDTDRKLWVYLHREREEEDFEDDGTSSTKKWKRQKKESAEPIDQAAVTVAYHGPGDQNVGDLGSDPNFDLPNIHEDKGKELEYEDSRDLCDDNVENHHGTEQGNPPDFGQTQVALDAMGENKLFCQENSTNDNFDDET